MPDAQPDVAIALSKETPAPIAKHVHGALLGSGCEVVFGDRLYLINLPAKKLEAHAELVGIELPLGPTASRTWSEQGYAVRDFSLDIICFSYAFCCFVFFLFLHLVFLDCFHCIPWFPFV